MIRALIIDDEPLAHKVILKYVTDVPDLEVVGQCYRATEAYPFLTAGDVDLLFLDINLPRLKGLDFLRTLDRPPLTIVTSAHEEYALEGYELRVVDYLLKPFRFERFLRAITEARSRLSARQTGLPASYSTPQKEPKDKTIDHLFVRVDRRQQRIALEELEFIEAYGNYVKLWLGKDYVLSPRTLSSMSDELPAQFEQVHKSYIVNRSHITFLEGARLGLTSGHEVGVGKQWRGMVKEWFGG